MSGYIDIHSHILSGVDDGARDDAEMCRMLDMAYSSGTRTLCLTPHFSPQYFDINREATDEAFEKLRCYAADKYPDMRLILGNELNFFFGSDKYIVSGDCRTLGGSHRVLVDFRFDISFFEIKTAFTELKSQGFKPIFAHAERYDCIKPPYSSLEKLKKDGIFIHLNASSVTGEWGRKMQKKAFKIIKLGLADAVASDAHALVARAPRLDIADAVLKKRFGESIATSLLKKGPEKILGINK